DPVTAQFHGLYRAPNLLKNRAPEKNSAGTGNGVLDDQILGAFFATGSDEVVSPAFLIQIGGPVVQRTEDATRAIYLHRLAIGDANLGILIEQGHQAGK